MARVAKPRIDKMRDIVENGYKKIDGVTVDSVTANAYVKVYDALASNPQHQADLEARPLVQAVNIVWRLIK